MSCSRCPTGSARNEHGAPAGLGWVKPCENQHLALQDVGSREELDRNLDKLKGMRPLPSTAGEPVLALGAGAVGGPTAVVVDGGARRIRPREATGVIDEVSMTSSPGSTWSIDGKGLLAGGDGSAGNSARAGSSGSSARATTARAARFHVRLLFPRATPRARSRAGIPPRADVPGARRSVARVAPSVVDLHRRTAEFAARRRPAEGGGQPGVLASTIACAMMLPAMAVVLSPCPPKPLASHTPGDSSPMNGIRCSGLPSTPDQTCSTSTSPSCG